MRLHVQHTRRPGRDRRGRHRGYRRRAGKAPAGRGGRREIDHDRPPGATSNELVAITDGAADANLLAAEGIAVLDGLGPVGGDDHSLTEWLDLTSVVPRITLLAGLMVELAGSPDVVSDA